MTQTIDKLVISDANGEVIINTSGITVQSNGTTISKTWAQLLA